MERNLLLIKEFNWDLAFCFYRMGQMTSSRTMMRLVKSVLKPLALPSLFSLSCCSFQQEDGTSHILEWILKCCVDSSFSHTVSCEHLVSPDILIGLTWKENKKKSCLKKGKQCFLESLICFFVCFSFWAIIHIT